MKAHQLAARYLFKDHPIQVILFVTSRCNLRCKMCFYWIPIETPNLNELTLEEMTTLAKSMKPFAWLLLAGGETFIRKDLAEIIDIFVTHNGVSHVTIPTNGWYTDRIVEVMDTMCTQHPHVYFNLDLSVEGPEELHDEIVKREGAYKRLFETHDAVAELRKKHSNLGMGAIFTMSNDNQDKWVDTLKPLVNDFKFQNVVMTKTRGEPKDMKTLDVDTQNYRDASAYLESCARNGKLSGFKGLTGRMIQSKDAIMHDTIAKIADGDGYQMPCQAGKLSVVISENGKVFACELLQDEIGDLREHNMNFQKVWNSQAAKDLRHFIRDTNCFCTHECFTTINILSNPSQLPRLISEARKGR